MINGAVLLLNINVVTNDIKVIKINCRGNGKFKNKFLIMRPAKKGA